jgi:uncharacterized phage-like protein YoqJ
MNKLNEQLVYLLGFHAYINETHGSRSKIPSKKSRQQRCAEGFNSGVKWLLLDGHVGTNVVNCCVVVLVKTMKS